MGSGALEGARRATGNAPDPGAPMAGGVFVQSGGRAFGTRVADARTIGLGLWQRRRDTGSNRQVIPSVAPHTRARLRGRCARSLSRSGRWRRVSHGPQGPWSRPDDAISVPRAGCPQRGRAGTLGAAGTRYQASFAGRLAHAQRQRRYRARRQEVTHQGSPPPAPPVEVRTAPTVPESVPSASGQCHLCHRALSPFVRQDFLHSPVRRPCPRSERSPPRHGPVP